MHAVKVLHTLLRRALPSIHARRLSSLMAMVDSALRGHRLTLCELARHLAPSCSVRHRIKRADRLLGNRALHAARLDFYRVMARRLIVPGSAPVILVDWSDATADHRFVMLRAALRVRGFALPFHEEVHPLRRLMAPVVERDFLRTLQQLLGDAVRPVVVTDAGFRGPWFTQVERIGWHRVGRVRGRTRIQRGDGAWVGCRALLAQATGRPADLGRCRMIQSQPVSGRMVLYRKAPQGRQQVNRRGQRTRRKHSEVCAQRKREPWLLCASVSLAELSARELVRLYGQRMRIEQSFRALKSHQFGFSFEDTQSQMAGRLQMLLVQALALFVLWIAGVAAERQALRPAYESNARRTHPAISLITLGWLVLAEQALRLRLDDFRALPPAASDQGEEI
jgi:hypothetical protein